MFPPSVWDLFRENKPVVNVEFPRADVIQFPFEKAFLQWGEMVGEHDAVQVVVLVLDDAGLCAFENFRVLHPVLVPVGDFDSVFSHHVLVNAGNAETAFVERDVVAGTFKDVGVDECLFEPFAGRVDVGKSGAVYYE